MQTFYPTINNQKVAAFIIYSLKAEIIYIQSKDCISSLQNLNALVECIFSISWNIS